MTPEQAFKIIYDLEVIQHFVAIDRQFHSLIRCTIDEQLSYQPDVVTRNRKPLQPPAPLGATWELRIGPNNRFRVLYQIIPDVHEVYVVGIGVKIGNQLLINGKILEP